MIPETWRPNDLRNADLKWYVLGQIIVYLRDKHSLLGKTYNRIFERLVDLKGETR